MFWNYRTLYRIDLRVVPLILALMVISLLIISATDPVTVFATQEEVGFLTPKVLSQLQRFVLGWAVFVLFAGMDYNKLREWAWVLYVGMVIALVGLFLVPAIQNVHRWYRVPLIGVSIQPSEYAKLIMVISLSWFLERSRLAAHTWRTVFQAGLIVMVPFLLILKQPDLGTALVLCPISLMMFYLGNVHPTMVRTLMMMGLCALLMMLTIFLGVVSHEQLRPYALKVLKEYQYERLDPNNHHQQASLTAIGVGGLFGRGWRSSDFTGHGWLPYGYTDSVFSAFGEEFGLVGLFVLLVIFYSLIYVSFQVTAVAKDHFGRMLSAGVTVYLAMHMLMNIGMMCGLLPITGVPLILVSYGGSSVFVTMAALGILQSVYTRRFMF